MILGLDISTTHIGYAIVKDKNIVTIATVNLPKGTIYSKALFFTGILDDILSNYHIDEVHIEDNLLFFSMGRTSAEVIVNLAKINAIISFYLAVLLNEQNIFHINPTTARKSVFGTISLAFRKKFKDNKRSIVYLLLKRYGRTLYKQLPKNRKGFLHNSAYDACDALVSALASPTILQSKKSHHKKFIKK